MTDTQETANDSTSQKSCRGCTWVKKNRVWLGILLIVILLGLYVKLGQSPKGKSLTTQDAAMMTQGYWGSSWDMAVEAAKTSGRPILIDFTAEWCPPCQVMISRVFPDPSVVDAFKSHFVLLQADVTGNDSPGVPLATKYKIESIPTFLIVDTQGKILATQVGQTSADQFAQWLKDNANRHKVAKIDHREINSFFPLPALATEQVTVAPTQ